MYFIAEISPPIDLSRLTEAAMSPLCHHDKVFERNPGEYWLETNDRLYRLAVSPENMITAAYADTRPSGEFLDLFQAVGVAVTIRKVYKNKEERESDWEAIAKRYHLHPIKAPSSPPERVFNLRPAEEEALRAIQLVAGPDSRDWIDVSTIEFGFARNLRVTLRALARKGFIHVTPRARAVRLK